MFDLKSAVICSVLCKFTFRSADHCAVIGNDIALLSISTVPSKIISLENSLEEFLHYFDKWKIQINCGKL